MKNMREMTGKGLRGAGVAVGVLIVLLGVCTGCGSSECLDNQNSRPNAVFLMSGGENTGSALTVDSLTVVGFDAPDDTPLVKDESLNGLTLPFRLGDTETSYVFEYGGELKGLRDVITFNYRPVPEFVSEACGAIYAFEDVQVTYTNVLIDSVVCPWKTINNIERDYIRIYFRVADE